MRLRKMSLMMAMIVALSTLAGCSKEKEVVFESDVAINNTSDKKVIQEEVQIDLPKEMRFSSLYYDGDKIIGAIQNTLYPNEIDNADFPINGVFKKTIYSLENDKVVGSNIEFILASYRSGMEGIYNGSKDTVYYYNYKTNENREVGKVLYPVDIWNNPRSTYGDNSALTSLVKGNNDFGYIVENYKKNSIAKITFQLIDLKNDKTYLYKKQGEDESFILDVMYSNATEKFYALKDDSNIYEITIKGEEIVFNKKVSLSNGLNTVPLNIKVNEKGEIQLYVAANYFYNSEKNTLMGIYNPETNKMQEITQDTGDNFVGVVPIEDTNYLLLQKGTERGVNNQLMMQEYYIGKENNGKIDIYHKIDVPLDYGDELNINKIIINDKGNEIFLDMTKVDNYIKENSTDHATVDIYMKLMIQE